MTTLSSFKDRHWARQAEVYAKASAMQAQQDVVWAEMRAALIRRQKEFEHAIAERVERPAPEQHLVGPAGVQVPRATHQPVPANCKRWPWVHDHTFDEAYLEAKYSAARDATRDRLERTACPSNSGLSPYAFWPRLPANDDRCMGVTWTERGYY